MRRPRAAVAIGAVTIGAVLLAGGVGQHGSPDVAAGGAAGVATMGAATRAELAATGELALGEPATTALLELQRREVEAFARSIAGDVRLDFEWAPLVAGYGADGTYGGTATWDTVNAGYSTVTLSDSVAQLWRSNPAVASLVAHEIGHSVTGRCAGLFRGAFDSQPEVFATAWAIGLGYDLAGSGESIYGRPSDALIDLATQCR